MRPGIVLAAVAFAAAALPAFSTGLTAAKDNAVAVGALFFCDASKVGQVCETNVTDGDTVTWTVQAGTHTVTQCSDSTFGNCSGGFASDVLSPGETYVQTFAAPATIYYRCELHPDTMLGKIVAAAAAPASPSSAVAPTASPTAAPSLPNTGGTIEDNATTLKYSLLALGGVLIAGSGLGFALTRRRQLSPRR